MSKMITTSNTKFEPRKREGIKEKTLEDGTVVLVSEKALTTITTGKVRPKTRLEGEEKKGYYPPLTTTLLHEFPKTKKGKRDRDRFMEEEADKKRVADGVSPVLSKKGTGTNK